MNKELNKYIKKELKKGFSLKQIRNTLLKDDYKKDMVSEALSQFKEKDSEVKIKKSFEFHWDNRLFLIVGLVVLLVFGYFGYNIFKVDGGVKPITLAEFLPTVEEFVEVLNPTLEEDPREGWIIAVDRETKELKLFEKLRFKIKVPIESHSRWFEKKLNFSDLEGMPHNFIYVKFDISKYANNRINEIIQETRSELQTKGVEHSLMRLYFLEGGEAIINDKIVVLKAGESDMTLKESGKIVTFNELMGIDDSIEYLEIINEDSYSYFSQCAESIKEEIWTRICCSYPKQELEDTCTDIVHESIMNLNNKIDQIQ